MFRFVSLFTITILASAQNAFGSNLHSASIISSGHGGSVNGHHGGHAAPAYSAISSNHHGVPAHHSVISSYSSTVVHPNSAISHPILRSHSISQGAHNQHISGPSFNNHQIYSTPLVSGRAYSGHSGSHGNSNGVQNSYTGPFAVSAFAPQRLISAPMVVSGYGAQLGQARSGEISGHFSRW